MSGCTGCDKEICPKSDKNEEIVKSIIVEKFEGVDLEVQNQIDLAKRAVFTEIIARGLKPCTACVGIDKYINEQRSKLKREVFSILKLKSPDSIIPA